jgi:hypothetical protein
MFCELAVYFRISDFELVSRPMPQFSYRAPAFANPPSPSFGAAWVTAWQDIGIRMLHFAFQIIL